MNKILQKQNQQENIKLLRASTVAYTKAKSWETRISYFLIALAFLYPLCYVYSKNDNFQLVLFGCSFLLTVLIQAFHDSFEGNTSKGALFKETFDVTLFGLPWKSTLTKVDQAEVSKLSLQYKGPEIKDWYSTNISAAIPHNVAIAVCQRINTGWDIDLRKTYCAWIKGIVILYSIALFSFFVIEKVDGRTIFMIGFSILSFYTHFLTLLRGHSYVIKKRSVISRRLDNIISHKIITTIELRDLQDEIFVTRQESAKVPNFFFNLFKKGMNDEFEDYITSINSIYD